MNSFLNFRTILEIAAENSISAIAISDPSGNLVYVNKSFLSLWGYTSLEEVLGKNALDFWSTKEDAKKVMDTLLNFGSYFGELEGVKKDKSKFLSLVNGTISKSESGKIEFLFASFLDISVINALKAAIAERENYYSQILDSISDLIFCKDANLKITYVNQACAQHFGQLKSEIIGTIDNPENKQEFIDEYHKVDSKVIKEAKQVKIEREPHVGGDGLIRYFNTVKTPIRDNRGKVNELVAVARDITDSENVLEKLKLVTEITSDYIYTAKVIDGEIIAEWSSDNLSSIVGYTVEEIGKVGGWIKIIHPEDMKLVGDRVIDILEGKIGVCEYRVFAKNGEIVWLRDYSKPLRDSTGRVSSMIGASKNITQEKETEIKLQESNERFKASLEASIESIYFLSTKKDISGNIIDFVFTEMNEKGASELGFTREYLIGKGICDLFPVNIENGFFEQYKKVVQTKLPLEQEYSIPSGYHSPGYFHHQVLPTSDGIVIYNRNINDRVAKNKELEALVHVTNRQNDRLREYTYIISHNLRAPIANILSLSSLLKEDPTDTSLVQMIEASAHQLDHMMQNLNELLNIEKDSHTLIKKELQIKEEIQNQLLLFVGDKSNKTKVDVLIPSDLSLITIPLYFESILNNILSNAFKYLSREKNGYIKITTKEVPDFIIISISDNGIGIDLEKNRNRMFKMNSRFHSQVEGKGMGLFLTKYQIESLGGKIEVESQLDAGTTFHLYFPKISIANIDTGN